MEAVKKDALTRAMKMLDAVGCEYAIVDPDGERHGSLQVVEPKTQRSASRFPRGELTGYITMHLVGLVPGGVASIPFDKFTVDEIRGSVTPYCTRWFGRGNYTTTRNGNSIEVLRVA